MSLDDRLGQRRDVAQAKIEPLPGERMDDMGGVADQRQPFGDEASRDLEAERKGLDPRGEADRAELSGEAQFELAHEDRPVRARAAPRRRRAARSRRCSTGGRAAAGWRRGRRAGNAARRGPRGRARARSSRRGRTGRSPSRWSECRRARAASSARRRPRPQAGRGRVPPSESDSSPATCLPGRKPATEAGARATPSRLAEPESAATISSLKAMWASGSPSAPASKWRWRRRTASRTPPSMISMARIGCALGPIASQAPISLEQPPRPFGDRDGAYEAAPRFAGRRRRGIDDERRKRPRQAPGQGRRPAQGRPRPRRRWRRRIRARAQSWGAHLLEQRIVDRLGQTRNRGAPSYGASGTPRGSSERQAFVASSELQRAVCLPRMNVKADNPVSRPGARR